MSSQDTIEDPTLYQDMLPTNDFEESTKATKIEGSLHSIRSASHTSELPVECKKDSQDDEVDEGLVSDRPRPTADSSSHPELKRVLLSVTQLDSHLTQLKKHIEETADNIKYFMKRQEELNDALRNDVSKTKGQTPRRRQEGGILKRVKEESDDEHQLGDCTRCRTKRARVT